MKIISRLAFILMFFLNCVEKGPKEYSDVLREQINDNSSSNNDNNTAANNLAKSLYVKVPGAVIAGIEFPIVITVYDENGQILSAYEGPLNFSVSGGTGIYSISPDTANSFTNGNYSGKFILSRSPKTIVGKSEIVKITIEDPINSSISAQYDVAVYEEGTQNGPAYFSVDASPSNLVPGQQFNLDVTYYNLDATVYTDSETVLNEITWSGTGILNSPYFSSPFTGQTNISGFSIDSSGSGAISVSNGTHSGTSSTITVTPAISFATDVQPVFTGSCALSGCHISQSPVLSNNVSYYNIVNVKNGNYYYVKPNDSLNSYLYMKVKGDSRITGSVMPKPPRPLLSKTELDIIRNWIEQGAKNN